MDATTSPFKPKQSYHTMNDVPSPRPHESKDKSSATLVGCMWAGIILTVIVGIAFFVIVPRIMAKRQESIDNLKRIALALHNYHDTYREFPTAHFDDEDGTPRRSWRTAILPFIEESKLYEKYDHNQMWNSDKNLPLANETPEFLRSVFCDCSDGKTPFVVITGERTAFPEGKFLTFASFTDGTPNTLLVIADYENPVKWSEPVDVTLDDFLARYGDRDDAVLHVAMADARVIKIHKVPVHVLKMLAERNDGSVIPEF